MMNKRLLSRVLSFSFFCIVIFIAFQNRDHILLILNAVNPVWLVAGLFCYIINYFARSYRLWVYSYKTGLFFPVYLKISCIHGFNSYFLPMRSGDLTLPLLLRLNVQITLSHGSRVLVRARTLDIVSLGYLLFAAALFTPSNLPVSWLLLMMALGLCFVIVPYIIIYIIRRGTSAGKTWLSKIIGDGKLSYPSFQETFISLTIWFWTGGTIYCVIRSLDIPISFFDVWFLVAIQLPLQLMPVQGLANAGNHEAGWVIALGMLGISPELGLPLALSSHFIIICYVALLGGIGALLPTGSTKTTSSNSTAISG